MPTKKKKKRLEMTRDELKVALKYLINLIIEVLETDVKIVDQKQKTQATHS